MHKIYLKFCGYSNYYFLFLLYNKIKENEEEIFIEGEENVIDEEEKEDEYVLKRRYLIDTNDIGIQNLLKKNIGSNYRRRGRDLNNDDNDNNKEEIVFSNEQFCKKCGNIKNIFLEDIIKNQLNTYLDYLTYNCEKCKGNENEIIFKYHLLLSNLQKKEAIVCGKGEQKLYTPYKLYISIKNYFQKKKNYELNIPNIFNEKEINLPIIILYFSIINLPFDFLLPYKTKEKNNIKNKEKEEQKEFNPVKINIALQVSLFREQLRQADIVASLVAVPDGPTGIHTVGAVVGNLVGIHACHFLQERRIVHTMAGAGRERRQPLSLLLHHVHALLLSLRPGTRNISAVPLGKVQYLPQRPLSGLGKVHHIVVGSGRQYPARLTVILRKTRQRQTSQDHGGKSASHFYHTAGIIGIILSNNA